jgi:pimeloyl-ACP methyl ester carboxylesterase
MTFLLVLIFTPISFALAWILKSKWLTPILGAAAPAYPFLIELSRSGERAFLVLCFWVFLQSGLVLFFTDRWPDQMAALIWRGETYSAGMFQWIETGDLPEGKAGQVILIHIKQALLYCILAILTANLLSLVLGCALLNYMNFYVASLMRKSEKRMLALLTGWNPWSVIRVASFLWLGTVLAIPLYRWLQHQPPQISISGIAIGVTGIVIDIILKLAISRSWSRKIRSNLATVFLLLSFCTGVFASDTPRIEYLTIRGKAQKLYCYSEHEKNGKILLIPGDRSWHGFPVSVALKLTSWDYGVYGFDTTRYLESYKGKNKLKEFEVANDLGVISNHILLNKEGKVTLVGWSEGAGLCLLAASSEYRTDRYDGFISIGLTESSELGWHWFDFITYITKKDPKEPMFFSSRFLPGVSPLPFVMIQSSHDPYVSTKTAENLYESAGEPKRLMLIRSKNHRFDDNRNEFYARLKEALGWIQNTEHTEPAP